MRRTTALLALAAALAGFRPPAAAAAGSPVIEPAFDWTMEERFGIDGDGDGLIDIPNNVEYVHNRVACPSGCGEPHFRVAFDASATVATLGGEPLPIVLYRWDVVLEDGTGPLRHLSSRPEIVLLLPEGSHRVSLTVTALIGWGTVAARTTLPVTVDDLLVVALGDSYASGEGNPETARHGSVPARWGDGGVDPSAEAGHEAAHRSSLAWPAQAALVLERSDPRTSVTFVFLAESGARIDRGLLGPSSRSESQIAAAADLVGGRDVDLVLLSIGGNDVGFARMIRGLVQADRLFDPFCYETNLQNVWAAVVDGDWNRGSRLVYSLTSPWRVRCRATSGGDLPLLPGLAGLPEALDRAASAIDATLHPAAVYLAEYPDPGGRQRDDGLGTCGEIVGDTTPPFRFHEIDAREQAEGRERMLEPLNRILAEAAGRPGWRYLGGIADAFAAGHGYCASWPDYGYPDEYRGRPWFLRRRLDYPEGWYRNLGVHGPIPPPGGTTTTWYRSAAQSSVLQGPGARYESTGTLHPNELGHRAIAEAFLDAYRAGRP